MNHTTFEGSTLVDENIGKAPDADTANRPGVPMENDPPKPAGNAHWATPARQPDPGGILRRKDLTELTPVFGVTIPPRGLSGLLRRRAYALPEHYTSHWLVLLLADRVDAFESRLRRPATFVPLALAAVVGVTALAMRPKRRRWFR